MTRLEKPIQIAVIGEQVHSDTVRHAIYVLTDAGRIYATNIGGAARIDWQEVIGPWIKPEE